MKKSINLHQWLLKWHFTSGIIILPFVLVLSITGFIYLFKDNFENPQQVKLQKVVVKDQELSYQKQWEIVNNNSTSKPHSIVISNDKDKATEFISGKFDTTSHLFVDPYTGVITGEIVEKNTAMHKIRKLHGELLLGSWGTKIVELIGSWLVVMLLTGIYIWWPIKKWRIFGFIIPRLKNGKHVFFRDLHAITGFWISVLLLMILAGGLPWTDVFGSNFKKLQKITNTGYPSTWSGEGLQSKPTDTPMSIDEMVSLANTYNLSGIINLKIPNDSIGVYSLSNTDYKNLHAQKMIHFDQYSGDVIVKHNWEDVGVLMRARMWFMAFHQGQMGKWNFLLIAVTAFMLTIMSISAATTFFMKKYKGTIEIQIPQSNYKPKQFIFITILVLGIVLPLFGLSLIIIAIVNYLNNYRSKIT